MYADYITKATFSGVHLQHGGNGARRVSAAKQEVSFTSPQRDMQMRRTTQEACMETKQMNLFHGHVLRQERAGQEDVPAVGGRLVSVAAETDQGGSAQER